MGCGRRRRAGGGLIARAEAGIVDQRRIGVERPPVVLLLQRCIAQLAELIADQNVGVHEIGARIPMLRIGRQRPLEIGDGRAIASRVVFRDARFEIGLCGRWCFLQGECQKQ